jgi:myo-inositol-1(or 4)-monophosphatase
MTPDPASLLPVALRAAELAADLMRTRRPVRLTEKHDRDLVSDVDIAIERQVRAMLEQATPDIGFLGEEEGLTGDSGAGWLWTLDPIDGTSNYAHGIPLCAMSLALLHDGRPVVAVIDAPFLGQRYHAVQGAGAFIGDQQLAVSATRHLRDAIVSMGDYATGPGADRTNEKRLALTVQLAPRVHRLRMIGTAALDLAWVAEGRLDASITLTNSPWDMSAGVLIAREAGASVIDSDGSPYTLRSAATIAAAPALVDQLVLLVHSSDSASTPEHDPAPERTSPYASIDAPLLSSKVLLFDFDGPVCDFSGALPGDAARRLGEVIAAGAGVPVPALSATGAVGGDLLEVLAAAKTLGPETARKADAEITGIELAAAGKAAPAAYVHEAIAACRDSGRVPAIISRHSVAAVRAWLARFGLDDQIRHVFAAGDYPPGHLRFLSDHITDAVSRLEAAPRDCALMTANPDHVTIARQAGLRSIGYARTATIRDHLSDAGAEGIVLSLADLTLRLRARPLSR